MKILKGISLVVLALTMVACSNNKVNFKISEEEAKSIALKHANIDAKEVTFKDIDIDKEKDTYVYDMEFYDKAGQEYEYYVHADTGEVLKYNHEKKTTAPQGISMQQAKDKVFEHALVKEADVTLTKALEEKDDGRDIYEIDFYDINKFYEYDIDKQTGDIIGYDVKKKNPTTSTSSITLEQAKTNALKDAQITDTNINYLVEKEDIDDGIKVYELKFQYNNKVYDFEIEKSTGDILSFEVK